MQLAVRLWRYANCFVERSIESTGAHVGVVSAITSPRCTGSVVWSGSWTTSPRYGWTWKIVLVATTFHWRSFLAPTGASTVIASCVVPPYWWSRNLMSLSRVVRLVERAREADRERDDPPGLLDGRRVSDAVADRLERGRRG